MKHLTLIISILICSNLIGQNLETRLTELINAKLFERLDSLSIDRPIKISCIDNAAQHQSIFISNNSDITSHIQYESIEGKTSIGDTIAKTPDSRMYIFCDTLYQFSGEILYRSSFYSDTALMLNELPNKVIKGFVKSEPHRKIMESKHEFYGIGIRIKQWDDDPSLMVAVVVVTYGKKFSLFNNSLPKHFTINTTGRLEFKQRCMKNIIIRNN